MSTDPARELASPLFVVGDPHGHRRELTAVLREAGLVDAAGDRPRGDWIGDWAGGDARVWVLGDLLDRGPDGIGVINDLRRWSAQADDAGGEVSVLLGNHEILALGTHRFGDTPVPGDEFQSFAQSWLYNGGLLSDQAGLTDEHVNWLCSRPVIALVDDHLLMHSDTVEYLGWGDTVDAINATVASRLADPDLATWWDIWCRMTDRYAFLPPDDEAVAVMLGTLGGHQIVHGHSIVGDLRNIASVDVDGPWMYAAGRVLAVDGGMYDGGPLMVVPLPCELPAE